MLGSGRLLQKSSVDAAKLIGLLLAGISTMLDAVWAAEQPLLRHYEVVGDAIPDSLTGSKGDPTVGRAIVLSRQSTCLLCHSGPFKEERFQGNVGPDLTGAGSRWSEGQLRLRIVDAARLNPATIMPPFYRIEGLNRVNPAWRGNPILSAEQIEDVVAFLATLQR
jgi:L-cysteine S-thiosulfotransferase